MEIVVPILIAGFLAGMVRGFAGFGAALLFVPIASVFIDPPKAVVLIAAVDGVLALALLPDAFRTGVRSLVLPLLIGATLTLPMGAYLLSELDAYLVRWAVCSLVLISVLCIASGWRYRGPPTQRLAVGAGLASGFMGGLAALIGPSVMVFLMHSDMPAKQLRGTVVLFLAVLLVVGAVVFVALGLVPSTLGPLALTMAPAYGVGLLIGMKFFQSASEQMFKNVAYLIIVIGAVAGLPLFDSPTR